jgi:hypothetical protein
MAIVTGWSSIVSEIAPTVHHRRVRSSDHVLSDLAALSNVRTVVSRGRCVELT